MAAVEIDQDTTRDGLMAGYLAWIAERRREWSALMGMRKGQSWTYADHQAFDAWLRAIAARAAG